MSDIPEMNRHFSSQSSEQLANILNVQYEDYRSESLELVAAILRLRGVTVVETEEGPRVSDDAEFPVEERAGQTISYERDQIPNDSGLAYLMALFTGVASLVALVAYDLRTPRHLDGSFITKLLCFVGVWSLPSGVFGYVWPRRSWGWGIWISLPMSILGLIGTAFSFVSADPTETRFAVIESMAINFVPIVALACLGGVAGASLKRRRASASHSLLEHPEQ